MCPQPKKMFRINTIKKEINTEEYYVIPVGDAFWVSKKDNHYCEDNAVLLANVNELLRVVTSLQPDIRKEMIIKFILGNLRLFNYIDQNYGQPINSSTTDSGSLVKVSCTAHLKNFIQIIPLGKIDIINEIMKKIDSMVSFIGTYKYKEIKQKHVKYMRELIKNDADSIQYDEINTAIYNTISHGEIKKTIQTYCTSSVLQYIYYNYYDLHERSRVLTNNYSIIDYHLRKAEPVCLTKDLYYVNSKTEFQEPLFEYEDSDYFYPHQKESIGLMERMEMNNIIDVTQSNSVNKVVLKTNFGVLANGTGTGKTRIMAALILRDVFVMKEDDFKYEPDLSIYVEDFSIPETKNNISTYVRVCNYGKYSTFPQWINTEKKTFNERKNTVYKKNRATLIVASKSLIGQWESTILDMAKHFNVDVSLCILTTKKKNVDFEPPEDYDIIITTDSMYNKYYVNLTTPVIFNRIIYDEPDTVKYTNGDLNCNARFKWLVSATLIDKIKSSNLGSRNIGERSFSGITRTDSMFKLYNKLKIYSQSEINNSNHIKFIEYRNFLDTFFIDNFRNYINRVDVSLAEAFASGNDEIIERILGIKPNQICKLDLLYMNYIKNNDPEIKNLDDKLLEISKCRAEDCPICLCEMDYKNAILYDCCFHMIHTECSNSRSVKCPMCRTEPAPMFKFKDTICYKRLNAMLGIEDEDDEQDSDEDEEKTSGDDDSEENKTIKVRNDIFKSIFKKQNSKVIVYATCNEKDNVVAFIKKLNFKMNVLKGTVRQRHKIIQEFKSGEVPILLLLNHKNTAGLTLIEATDLIIYNRSSNIIMEQVIGRVDRYGLNHNVNVHLLDTSEDNKRFIKSRYKDYTIEKIDIKENQ